MRRRDSLVMSKTSLLPKMDRVEVDPAAVANYASEWAFVVLASDLLREVASYTCAAACTLGPTPSWNRDQAAIGGNMVRLFKLLFAFQHQTCQKHRETSEILGRFAFETAVNVRYRTACTGAGKTCTRTTWTSTTKAGFTPALE